MDGSIFALVTLAPAALVFLVGCTQLPAAGPDPDPVAEPTVAKPAVAKPAVAEPALAEPAKPAPTQPVPSRSSIEAVGGTVVAIESAGPYRYVTVEAEDAGAQGRAGERTTVVVLGDAVFDVGQTGRFSIHGERQNFHSKRLDKTFDTLLFGSPSDTDLH